MSSRAYDPAEEAERVVEAIINGWVSRKKYFKCRRTIVYYHASSRHGHLDKDKIDGIVFFDSGLSLAWQITTFLKDKKKNNHLPGGSHAHIPIILEIKERSLPQDWDDREAYRKIASYIENQINRALKKHLS